VLKTCIALWEIGVARIIYIEDDDLVAQVVKDVLTTAGHLVGVVAHGTLGADTVALKKPDMAIVDLSLPGTGGIEVIQHLRRTSSTYLMPILVLTANRTSAAADAALEAGATDVMTKPFSADDIVERVTKVLETNLFATRG
jgi:DNA-binding response OmpR family regulator